VDRTQSPARIIDIVAVDPDERGACIGEALRCGFGQERVTFLVRQGAPVTIPPGVDEHGAAFQLQSGERLRVDRMVRRRGP